MADDTTPFPFRSDALVPLESVLCTEELDRRPARPSDFEAEHCALLLLVQDVMAGFNLGGAPGESSASPS